jgi:metallophosphoesterase superfamily enzyme
MLSSFMSQIGIPVHLVSGNHDAKIRELPCGMESHPFMDRGNLRIIHDPDDAETGPLLHLAGHWHPVAKIRDGKRTSLRLPAFLLRQGTLVLPAFGSFTGGAVIHPDKGDRIFVPMRDQVIEVPDGLL